MLDAERHVFLYCPLHREPLWCMCQLRNFGWQCAAVWIMGLCRGRGDSLYHVSQEPGPFPWHVFTLWGIPHNIIKKKGRRRALQKPYQNEIVEQINVLIATSWWYVEWTQIRVVVAHKISREFREELKRAEFMVSVACSRLNIPLLIAIFETICKTEIETRSLIQWNQLLPPTKHWRAVNKFLWNFMLEMHFLLDCVGMMSNGFSLCFTFIPFPSE